MKNRTESLFSDYSIKSRGLTSQEINDYCCFPIVDGNIGNAVERADIYGTTMMEFKFAYKYFVLIVEDAVYCFPTLRTDRQFADFMDYLNEHGLFKNHS